MRYFFDSESQQCLPFQYGGCGGNANRFSSAYDCLHACKRDSVCLLEWDEGEPCDENEARNVFFYFDIEEKECSTEVGYECVGNGNRFHSGMDCLSTCDPGSEGPTDIDGNPCWEIACDIPFCGEGVEVVYSDDYCCPVCPTDDVEECEDDEFRCRDGACIPGDWECDGLADCDDGSDERGEECRVDIVRCGFSCSEEECVPDNYACDGVLDCSNARDEQDCDVEYVPGAPFYFPPLECPESTNVLGPCDISECVSDTECGGGRMCCLNNCNQFMCVEPTVASPACRAIAGRLSPNVSYVPECLESGNFRPRQCTGEGEQRMCWCVNIIHGTPFTPTSNDVDLDCTRCRYDGSDYVPGETYPAEDGCNTWWVNHTSY
jgi:hypothetical protein